jgi:HPt (histidine-containing phosphotransfer) domain-containing protein
LKNNSFDPASLWQRLDGDAELLRDLVKIFLDESPGLIQKIGAAIEQGNSTDVRKLSHKLKGSALQFSGIGLVAVAARLEEMGDKRSLQGADQVFSKLKEEVDGLAHSLRSLAERKRMDS